LVKDYIDYRYVGGKTGDIPYYDTVVKNNME
jgi:hypothetical protein